MTVAKTVLRNGATVVSERVPWLSSVTAGIWVPGGSRDEAPDECGISHFIEHMLFKGTRRRSALDLSREIESVGGTMNAATDREYTFFYAKALRKDFPLAVDILSDIYLESVFDPAEFERERSVVLQEILMVDDSPEDVLHDLFHNAFWGGHPLGAPVQGTSGTVSRFSREGLLGFFRERFRPRGLVLGVIGDVPHDEVAGRMGEAFGGAELAEGRPAFPEPSPHPGVVVREKPIEQLHVCLGAPAVSRGSERRYVAHVLNAVLGGSMSSRLFQEVRERRGLCYSVFSALSSYAETGILKIAAGTTRERGGELLDVTGRILDDLRAGGAGDDEVARSKELLKGSILMSLESPEYRLTRLLMSEMVFGRHEGVEEALAGVDAVTAGAVRDLAAEILDPSRFAMAVLGDVPAGGLALPF